MSAITEFGYYQAKRVLATGTHAQVWEASGPPGDVALKVAKTEADRAHLLREADLLDRCRHPNVARILDRDPSGKWIATGLAPSTLREHLSTHAGFAEIARVGAALCDALTAVHSAELVHGDVKPNNVLLSAKGWPILIDFGVATRAGEERRGFRGTLGFVAPEVLRGEAPTFKTDLYGLGAVLYSAITDRPPFVAPDPAALTYLPLVSLPAPPVQFRTDVPADLQRIVLALLARDPARRPSLAEVKAEIAAAAASAPAAPIVGMAVEREELRRAVVGAADGEPRVVVLYGPAGSGRRTLISEAVDYARREGLPYLRPTDPKAALAQLRSERTPSVLVLRSQPASRRLAQAILDDGLPTLLLLHADRPAPDLQARAVVQLTPSPLGARDVEQLVRALGAPVDRAEEWWREGFGLPLAVVGRIRRALREARGGAFDPAILPAESRRVLDAVRAQGTVLVAALAERLQLGEHSLLDAAEVLFAEGVVVVDEQGDALRAV